ncbi:MAG: hypothetical protein MJZ34_03200 [Paludibacteraceae bacterium]|nr:hypothetical protein [Paludibacteraceae bacterium]
MAYLYNSIEELARSLYTVNNLKSPRYGEINVEVTDVHLEDQTLDYDLYQLKAIVRNTKVEPLEKEYQIQFKIPNINNPMKVSINLALIKRCYTLYTDKLNKIVGASFPGEFPGREGWNKSSLYIRPGKDSVRLGKHEITLNDFERCLKLIKTGNYRSVVDLLTEEVAQDMRDFVLQENTVNKLSLVLDRDSIDRDVKNEATWKLMLDIASGVYPYDDINEVTPYDISMYDLKRGLLFHLSEKMWMTKDEKAEGFKLEKQKTLRDDVWSRLNLNCGIFASSIENPIKNYYKTNGAILNMLQFVSDTNPLSYYTHSKKLYFVDPKNLDDEETHGKIRVNSKYLDGFLDPIRTQENAANVNFYQEMSLGCKVNKDKDYEITVKVYDKNFNVIDLPIKDYLNSAILSYDCVNYKTKQPKKNKNGVYKYCKRARYYVTQNLNDIDYYRHESSILSASTALMPMINRNDVTRDLLQAHFTTQAVPTIGCKPSIVHTSFADAIFDESTNVIHSDTEGEVVDISENGDVIKIKDSKGKMHYPHVDNKYVSTKKHTSNIFVPNVKIGDKVSVGDAIFKFNSFQGKELALYCPLLTTYSTLRGYEVEDGYVISRSAAKKLAHPEFKTTRIRLVHDKYRLENMVSCNVGDKLDKDDVIFRFEENQLSDIAVSILGGRREAFVELEYRIPKFTFGATVTDIKILMNPMYVNEHHKYYSLMKDWRDRVLKKKREFLHNNIYMDRFEPSIENNECDFIIEITYEAFNEFKLSDKMTNRASSKGVVCAILPDEEMPITEDGQRIEVVMPALAMASRKNSFSLIECKLTKLSKRLRELIDKGQIEQVKPILDVLYQEIPVNKRYLRETYIGSSIDRDGFLRILIDPFDTTFQAYGMDPEDKLNELMEIAGIPDGGKEILTDGRTGRKIRTPLLVGWNEYQRSHFISEEKFSATPEIAYYKGGKGLTQELVMGMGHHRPGGQKIGEQELHALLASGKGEFLMGRTANSSYTDKNERITADVTNLLMRLKVKEN